MHVLVLCFIYVYSHHLVSFLFEGGGLVFWHSKGATIKREIEKYWTDKHIEASQVVSQVTAQHDTLPSFNVLT